MRKCPSEFGDVLSSYGERLLGRKKISQRSLRLAPHKRLAVFRDIIDTNAAAICVRLLDDGLYRHLELITRRIPADSIRRATTSYSEVLGKVAHVKTAFLQRKTARAYQAAEEIRLLSMLRSESFKEFAEAITGVTLVHDNGCQILCYEHGDYVGPHTDHFPENRALRHGYIDVHIMFSNTAVSHQWVVYEEKGHLSRIQDVNLNGAVATYNLPFWHYTTPLVGKRGLESSARRWVLLRTFGVRA